MCPVWRCPNILVSNRGIGRTVRPQCLTFGFQKFGDEKFETFPPKIRVARDERWITFRLVLGFRSGVDSPKIQGQRIQSRGARVKLREGHTDVTEPRDKVETVQKTVVVFDLSSSTTILEELKRIDRLDVWRNLFINMKGVLKARRDVELYKFMGDGWVLLYSPDVDIDNLMQQLNELSVFYFYLFEQTIELLIPKRPKPLGLTVGVDSGELIRLQMNDNGEYIGRAINVAARLQSKAKDFAAGDFTNVTLISRSTFNSRLPKGNRYSQIAEEKTVDLKNISGGEDFRCFLLPLAT
jgi:class 3 adenylate cyclase